MKHLFLQRYWRKQRIGRISPHDDEAQNNYSKVLENNNKDKRNKGWMY
ncbi:MAG: hypothetical protein ABI707_11705 [Ferruginibacter sp.]